MISTDFSELRKLELVPAQNEVAASSITGKDSNASGIHSAATTAGEFELVLGNEIFGWKLNRKWALGLAGSLILLMLLMTAYFSSRASRAENEKLKEDFQFRTINRE